MNLASLLDDCTAAHPDREALVAGLGPSRRSLTYRQLADRSGRLAAQLERRGIGAGDRVLLLVPMSLDLYVVLLGLFRLGGVPTFVDPGFGRGYVNRCCSLVSPAAMIGVPKAHLYRLLLPAVRRIRHHFVVGGRAPIAHRLDGEAGDGGVPLLRDVGPDAPALITFTSGSTGAPKVAVRTHGLMLAQHRAIGATLHPEQERVSLVTLPVVALTTMAAGVTTVLPVGDMRRPGAVDGGPILEQVLRERAESIVAAPTLVERLVQAAQQRAQTLATVQRLIVGGGPVFPRLLRAVSEIAPGADTIAVYGSTEAEPIAEQAASEIAAADWEAMQSGKGLLVGRPAPTTQLRVIRDAWGTPLGPLSAAEWEAVTEEHGRPGEIVVAGAHVLPGYLGGLGDHETKIHVDGTVWHRTGDAGVFDERGRLWLLGRCAARITDARGDLYPFQVEVIALSHPAVERAAAVQHAGKRVLLLAGTPSALPSDFTDSFRWASVDEVRWVPEIPVDRRHNTKVDYPALRRIMEKARAV